MYIDAEKDVYLLLVRGQFHLLAFNPKAHAQFKSLRLAYSIRNVGASRMLQINAILTSAEIWGHLQQSCHRSHQIPTFSEDG